MYMDKVEKFLRITENLKKSRKINSFNHGEFIEAGTIAHGLLDMEDSFVIIMTKFLPILSSDNIPEDKIDDTLFDIGEELRHILYHINDMNYYNYLKE